jgi:hypothetical protein
MSPGRPACDWRSSGFPTRTKPVIISSRARTAGADESCGVLAAVTRLAARTEPASSTAGRRTRVNSPPSSSTDPELSSARLVAFTRNDQTYQCSLVAPPGGTMLETP